MLNFTKRNLKVFFRDHSSVFFSLLGPIIIIGLYVLFLGDVWTKSFPEIKEARELMDNWVMAGLLAVTSVTTSMGAFGIMLEDRTRKINKDLYCAPIKRQQIAGGYIFATYLIGMILSLFTMILAEIYIVSNGGNWMSPLEAIRVMALLMLIVFANSSMMFFATTLIESEHAFSTVSTIIGTLIGFMTGIYLPIGVLPRTVQWIVKLFPPSHAAVLLRKVMMEEPLKKAAEAVPAEYITDLKAQLGVSFTYGSYEMPFMGSLALLFVAGILFFFLAGVMLSRKQR